MSFLRTFGGGGAIPQLWERGLPFATRSVLRPAAILLTRPNRRFIHQQNRLPNALPYYNNRYSSSTKMAALGGLNGQHSPHFVSLNHIFKRLNSNLGPLGDKHNDKHNDKLDIHSNSTGRSPTDSTNDKVIKDLANNKAHESSNSKDIATNSSRQAFISKSGSNFIHRYWLNMKWFLLRQNRPFNIDEISAFLSWILMGNFLWIFIGTTTFFGLLIYLGNTFMDGSINKKILTKLINYDNQLQLDTDDENFKMAWEDGKIKFNNIVVRSKNNNSTKNVDTTSKGADIEYRLSIDTIKLTLSLGKWSEGKGLIKDAELSGLVGEINFNQNWEFFVDDSLSDSYEFDTLKINDLKVIFKSNDFMKPLELILFSCDLNKVRRNWVVYDFLNANALSGAFNGSLFTLHKRQNQMAQFSSAMDGSTDYPWKKFTRLRIDQLDMSFLCNESSKLNWIQSGKVELIVDIMLPNEDDFSGVKLMEKSLLTTVKDTFHTLAGNNNGEHQLPQQAQQQQQQQKQQQQQGTLEQRPLINTSGDIEEVEENKYVVMDVKLKFSDLVAQNPTKLPCSSLTGAPYISRVDLKSLVTFINDKKFGLASKISKRAIQSSSDLDENPFDGSELLDDNTTSNNNGTGSNNYSDNSNTSSINNNNSNDQDNFSDDSIPPITFRLVHNLKDFENLDMLFLVTMMNVIRPTLEGDGDVRQLVSFENSNKFIDSMISETMTYLLLYKEEIQVKLIEAYTKRTNFEIFFNNFILGNLILVGLGSFVI